MFIAMFSSQFLNPNSKVVGSFMNFLSNENKCNILFGLHHSEKGRNRGRPTNLKELIIYTEEIYFVSCDLFYWHTTVQFRLRSRKIIVSQQRSIINKYRREFFFCICAKPFTNIQRIKAKHVLKISQVQTLQLHLAQKFSGRANQARPSVYR